MYNTFKQIEAYFIDRKQYGIKPGLQRIKRLLRILGNPQNKIHGIHVAGTNGKGSTISFLEQALIENSYTVGFFTSPSLTDLTGHMFINGEAIAEETFISIFNEIIPAIKELDETEDHPTEFEIITCLAFVYFSKYAQITLIETGMGGLEDTTNCFEPILSIITNITKDHTDFLGNSIEEIAFHKSGIIKENRPVITGTSSKEALKVIRQQVKRRNAKLYHLHKDFHYTDIKIKNKIQTYIWRYLDQDYDVSLRVAGAHQVDNSSLAMMALVLLKELGYSINIEKSLASFAELTLFGRYEVINKSPLIIVDGAHNVAGMEAFLQTVQTFDCHKKKHLLFAGFQDKDLRDMLALASPHFSSITLTTFDHPRAIKQADLADLRIESSFIIPNWKLAIKEILATQSNNKETTYYITGSFHFISLVRKYIQRE